MKDHAFSNNGAYSGVCTVCNGVIAEHQMVLGRVISPSPDELSYIQLLHAENIRLLQRIERLELKPVETFVSQPNVSETISSSQY